jgi:S1-C subfamily serine protease
MKQLALGMCITLALVFSYAPQTYAQIALASTKLDASSIYEKAAPSVVLITCVDAKGNVSSGSGVILRADGIIATNFHVISDAVAAKVQLSNSDIYDDISILDTDERKDIAILKIKAVNLPVLSVADSDSVKIGATVYAIGSPRGLTGSLSSGIVSSLRPASELSSELTGFRIIQFTAPISPGSSGGALLDDTGKLLGLVFAYRPGGQNLNVAIPVNYVSPLAANAKGDGRSLKKMPNIEESTVAARKTSDTLEGVYTGIWSSNEYNVSGTIVMTITKVDGQYQAKAVFTGSDYFNEDTFIATFTELGGGVWKMEYKGKKSKISGTGLFRGGRFVGDYKFRKFIWVDRGKWVLEK